MHSNICTHTDARTHVLRKRDIRECLSGNFVRLFPLFSALTQVESQASWTRAKFYNFPLKVLSPPFPAPSTPPAFVQHSCRPAKQLTHISVSAYATKWPKVAWWLVTIFFCLFPAALTLNFSPCCRAGSGFYCFQCLFFASWLQTASTRRKQTERPPRVFWPTEGTRATDATDDSGWTENHFLFSRSSSAISAASGEKAFRREAVRTACCTVGARDLKFLSGFSDLVHEAIIEISFKLI